MIASARASLMWGQGQITVISTQGDEAGQFNRLVEAVASGEKEGSLISIDLYQACEQNLFKLICKKNKEIWTPESEQAWIEKQIREFSPYHDSELLCIPSKSGSRVFPHQLLLNCTGTGELIVRKDFTSTTNNPNHVTGELNSLFHSLIKPHLDGFNIGRNITAQYLGFDVARSTDLSSIYVLAKDTVSNKLLTQLVVELKGCPFQSQKEFVKLIVGSLPELKSGAVDAVGVGANLAEELSYWCPKLQAVKANATYHDEHWIKLLKLFESLKLSIPNDILILKDLGGVQYIDGVPRLAKKRSEGRHFDSASSLQLAISTIQGEEGKRDARQPGMVWSQRLKMYIKRV